MIIEKKPDLNDTVSFRLVTGEELLGKLVAQDQLSITISKPIVVQMQMVAPNQAGLAFAPFMSTCDDTIAKFRFERTKLLCDPIHPRKDIGSKYVEMTTGITTAAPSSLLV